MKDLLKLLSIFKINKIYGLYSLIFLSFIAILLESIGVGLIVPLLTALIDDNFFTKYVVLDKIFNFFDISENNDRIFYFILILLLFYFLKFIYLNIYNAFFFKFLASTNKTLSNNLLKEYFERDYNFYINTNSSLLIRNVIIEAGKISSCVKNYCLLFIEFFILIFVISIMIFYEPKVTLIVITILFIIGTFSLYLILYYTRNWSELRQKYEGQRLKELNQGIGSFKSILVNNLQKNFHDKFTNVNKKLINISIMHEVLKALPRLYLELLFFGTFLIILIVLLLVNNNTFFEIIPIFGLFAAAAFRLMPSANRIITSFQEINFNKYAIKLIYKEFNLSSQKQKFLNTKRVNFKKNIKLKNISFEYNAKNKILTNIDIDINKGDVIGFVGESGSGKSTLVDLILGLLKPTNGSLFIDDVQYNDFRLNSIGYVPQDIYLTDDTIEQNIALGINKNNIDKNRISEVLEITKLNNYIDNLEKGVLNEVGDKGIKLSGGQLQRIGIARALYLNPDILILDEPSSALDIDTEKHILDLVYSLNTKQTIIIISHRLQSLYKCNKIYRVYDKNIKLINQELN